MSRSWWRVEVDALSVAGIVLGFVSCIGAMLLDGGSVGSLLELPALVIVGGGSVGAILLQSPLPTFLRGMRMLGWVVFPPHDDRPELLGEMVGWLRTIRRQFVLALDPIAEQQTDPFIRQGLRM